MQELICVLDRSGSMQSCADEAVIAFNLFLEQQKAIGEARLTLIWFDQNVEVAYDGLLLSEAPPLSHWPNGGMTALYDAVGTAFEYVCERFSREKPEKVVLAILTDGQENSSRKFSPAQAKNLIKHHRERYAWDVIFLG